MTFVAFRRRPSPAAIAGPAAVAAILIGMIYCQAHGAMSGTHAPLAVSLWWSATGLLPLMAAAGATVRQAAWLRAKPVRAAALLALGYTPAIAAGEVAYADVLLDAEAWTSALFRALPLSAAAAALATIAVRLWPVAPPPQAAPALQVPNEVALVRSAGNYLSIEVAGREMLIRLTLREAAQRLARRGFIQVHRTALVNLARVARTARQGRRLVLILDDGRAVTVGRAYSARVRSSLAGRRSSPGV